MSHGAIGTLDRMHSAMLAPKAKKGKKKKKASADEPEPEAVNEPGSPEGGAAKKKKKKKKKAKKSSIPEPIPMKYGAPQTCEQALANTISWSQNNNIAMKRATGVLTTVPHE
jgi:hypothetical protein